MSFKTITQFDQKYKTEEFKNKRNACPAFALFTVYYFFENKQFSKEHHENVLDFAIKNIDSLKLPKFINFGELLSITANYTEKNVMGTVIELVKEYGYNDILPNTNCHAIIFLKNSNFVAILYDGVYHIRDCHEDTQYDFNSKDELIIHLNNFYKFNRATIVDGVHIEEYSNIEYCIFNGPIILKNTIINEPIKKNTLLDTKTVDNFIKNNIDPDVDNIMNEINNFHKMELLNNDKKEPSVTEPINNDKKEDPSITDMISAQINNYDPVKFKEMYGFDLDITLYL